MADVLVSAPKKLHRSISIFHGKKCLALNMHWHLSTPKHTSFSIIEICSHFCTLLHHKIKYSTNVHHQFFYKTVVKVHAVSLYCVMPTLPHAMQ